MFDLLRVAVLGLLLVCTALVMVLAFRVNALRSPERLRFRYKLDGFDATWNDAMEAVVAAGGTLSHHHGVGRDQRQRLQLVGLAVGLPVFAHGGGQGVEVQAALGAGGRVFRRQPQEARDRGVAPECGAAGRKARRPE